MERLGASFKDTVLRKMHCPMMEASFQAAVPNHRSVDQSVQDCTKINYLFLFLFIISVEHSFILNWPYFSYPLYLLT